MLLLAAGLAVGGTLTYWLFRIASPRSTSPNSADAIVVLAGGQGERLVKAERLLDQDVASTLVLSIGDSEWPGADDLLALCDSGTDVVCLVPRPDSTRGEARTIAIEAEKQGWQRLVLVTSDYHLHRSTVWFERCSTAEILPVAAPSRDSWARITHELGGLIDATVLGRGCD